MNRMVRTQAQRSLPGLTAGSAGATTASILATLEPLVTVVLAALIFGERLSGAQLAGAAVMLGAVLVLTAQRAPNLPTNPREVAPCPQCQVR